MANDTTTAPQAENAASSDPAPSSAVANLTPELDAIDQALYGDIIEQPPASAPVAAAVPPAVAATEPGPAGDQTPQVEEPAAATEAAATVTTEEPAVAPEAQSPDAAERILPGRISTGQFSENTQRAMRLMHELNGGRPEGEGPYTLEACLGMVKQADSSSSTAAAVAEADPQPSATDILRSEVEALEAALTEAGEGQVLFGPEVAKQTVELAKKQAKLAALEMQVEQNQQAQIQSHVAQRAAVKQAVVSEYKDAEDTQTFLGARVAALVEEMKNPAHPDHERLRKTDAPRFVVETAAKQVASKLAAQFGITPEQALNGLRTEPPAAAPVPQSQPVAGNRNVVASGAQGAVVKAPPTEAEILAAAGRNPAALEAALGYGTSFGLGY